MTIEIELLYLVDLVQVDLVRGRIRIFHPRVCFLPSIDAWRIPSPEKLSQIGFLKAEPEKGICVYVVY